MVAPNPNLASKPKTGPAKFSEMPAIISAPSGDHGTNHHGEGTLAIQDVGTWENVKNIPNLYLNTLNS